MAVSILGSGSTPVTGAREFDPIPGGVPGSGGSVNISAGDTNNYVVTSTGVGDDIQGESNLQFDGTTLTVTGSLNVSTGSFTANGLSSNPIATLCTYNTSTGAVGYNAPATTTGTTYLRDNGTWGTPVGAGDVSKVGNPANNEIAVWTGDGTIEGESDLTYDGSSLNIGSTMDLELAGGDIFCPNMTIYSGTIARPVVWDNALGQLKRVSSNGGTSNFFREDGSWAVPPGTGDVTKVGTPASTEVAVWTGDGTIEGESDLTFGGSGLTVDSGLYLPTVTSTSTYSLERGVQSVLVIDNSTGQVKMLDSIDPYTEETTYLRGDGAWEEPPGTISIGENYLTNQPASPQLAVWTDSDTIKGVTGFTFSEGELTNILNINEKSTEVTLTGAFLISSGSFNITTNTSNSYLVNDSNTTEIAIRGSHGSTSSKIWESSGNAGIKGYNALAYSDTSGSADMYVEGDTIVLSAYTGSAYKTLQIDDNYSMSGVPTYADNAAAKTGGLSDNDIYRTSTGVLMIVYT